MNPKLSLFKVFGELKNKKLNKTEIRKLMDKSMKDYHKDRNKFYIRKYYWKVKQKNGN